MVKQWAGLTQHGQVGHRLSQELRNMYPHSITGYAQRHDPGNKEEYAEPALGRPKTLPFDWLAASPAEVMVISSEPLAELAGLQELKG